ncbi:MAG: ribokinase [Clostridia bacterium]|nr:ribokinase [Clostridia bacterium]
MKILNFGSCNIDYVYSVDHAVQTGETISADQMEIFAGGKGLNQSVAAARAGATVYHAGVIGSDGGFLQEILEDSGADVSFLQHSDVKNGHAIIQVNAKGNNSIIVYAGTNGMITKDYVDEVLSHFEAGDMVMLQNETSCVPYIIDKAFAKGMQVVFNPSPFTPEMLKMDLSKVTYLLVNETEAMGFADSDRPEEAITLLNQRYPNLHLVVTLGSEGCIYADPTERFSQAAYRVRAVDTTAAGDTFTGYFVAALADGKDKQQAVRLATAAAALSVMRRGASPSIPTMEDVLHGLAHLR